MTKLEKIRQLIEENAMLIERYTEFYDDLESGNSDISDYDDGNFNDTFEFGENIGAGSVYSAIKEILDSDLSE